MRTSFSTSAFSTLRQNSVSKTDSMTPPAPLTYEEATMGAADALQKAVGQLKEKYPPKSMQQRALETMEEPPNDKGESTESSENASSGENHEGGDSGDTDKSVDTYA